MNFLHSRFSTFASYSDARSTCALANRVLCRQNGSRLGIDTMHHLQHEHFASMRGLSCRQILLTCMPDGRLANA